MNVCFTLGFLTFRLFVLSDGRTTKVTREGADHGRYGHESND